MKYNQGVSSILNPESGVLALIVITFGHTEEDMDVTDDETWNGLESMRKEQRALETKHVKLESEVM